MKLTFKKLISILVLSLFINLNIFMPVNARSEQTTGDEIEIESIIDKSFEYLATQMNNDGGLRWFDETSSPAATIKTVIAMAAFQYPQDFLTHSSGNRPIDFLLGSGSEWIYEISNGEKVFNTARAGQLLTAIAAANENPHSFGDDNIDLEFTIKAHYNPTNGVFGQSTKENVIDQVWAIIGLAASNASIPVEAADWLELAQLEDGSWNDGYDSFVDTTPLAIIALIASGHKGDQDTVILSAVNFLMSQQNNHGGWQTPYDTLTNPNTTGVILQAITALDGSPNDERWQKENGNPHSALIALQQENGAFGIDYANAYSTADAIIGLSNSSLFHLGAVRRINQAINYISESQENDGGWGNVGQTIDVILALRSAGWDPNSFSINQKTPGDYILANVESYLENGPDAIGKTILGVTALNENPSDFGGIDLVKMLMDTYDESSGAFGVSDNTWHQSLAILALKALDVDIPQNTIKGLKHLQQEDGGWEYAPGFGTWPNNTALAIQALLAAKVSQDDPIIQKAFSYLLTSQNPEGHWGDSSTTAYSIMALNASRANPEDWKTEQGQEPTSALFSFQKNNGAFVYNWEFPEDNLMSTTAALIAVLNNDFIFSPSKIDPINYTGLIIDPGDESWQSVCIPFEEKALTGLELLQRSGFSYDINEGFVNSLLNISNPDGGTMYWSYWYWNGREWEFYNVGAGETKASPGSIQAWLFASWENFPSPPPDGIPSIYTICHPNIVKDYVAQPCLNFFDLAYLRDETLGLTEKYQSDPSKEGNISAGNLNQTRDNDTKSTSMVESADDSSDFTAQEQLSFVPIIIIAILGGGVLFLIIIMNKRKHR